MSDQQAKAIAYYDMVECDLSHLSTGFESLAAALSDSKPLLPAEIREKAEEIVSLMLDCLPRLKPGAGPQ